MRTPVTGTSANGAAAPTAAANAGTSRPQPLRPTATARARRSATSVHSAHSAENPMFISRPRRRGSGQAAAHRCSTDDVGASPRPEAASAFATSGATLRPAVGVDEETDAAAVFRQEPAERVGAPDDALARRLPLALQRFDDPGLVPAPAPAQHRTRAGVAAGVGGDVQQPRRPEHRPHPGHLGDARLRQRERLPVGGGERVVDFDRHLVQRQQAEPVGGRAPALDDLGPRRRPGERIARRARGMRGHEHTDCGDQGRKSPAPGRHGREVNTAHRSAPQARCAMPV